jgi:hypothetical protein
MRTGDTRHVNVGRNVRQETDMTKQDLLAELQETRTVMTKQDLLTELRETRTDLPRFVEAASHTDLRYLVVPCGAVKAWEDREPRAWVKVRDWLTAQGKTIVELEKRANGSP